MPSKAAPGTLSQDQFDKEAVALVKKANALGYPWTLVEVGASGFTFLKRIIPIPASRLPSDEQPSRPQPGAPETFRTPETAVLEEITSDFQQRELEDSATLPSIARAHISLEIHVVYSKTWRCPVLYFNAWNSNTGTPISLDVLKRAVRNGLPDLDPTARTSYHMPVMSPQVQYLTNAN
ncbi:hypothetical protein HDU86_001050 [Geranomyces michiganensis]|nr:hypothetical protein HDU86_001050 [Geranomyces michiganensis]